MGIALVLALVMAVATPAPAPTPALWRVHGQNGAEVTLFGSIQDPPPGLVWRTPALDAALADAKVVVFEVDGPPEAAGASLERAMAEGVARETLAPKLSPAGRARLRQAAKDLDLDLDRLDHAEPWLAEMVIARRRGAKAATGPSLESQIAAGLRLDVRTVGLERPEEAINLRRSAPEAVQLISLERQLADAGPDLRAGRGRSLSLWLAGDVKGLEAVVAEGLPADTPRDLMLRARTRLWLARLETLLSDTDNAVIVVGTEHLVGPDGLPAILRTRGYTVEGP